jgi:predicted PurR-regulated permease PerM
MPGAEPGAVEKVQQAADVLRGSEKSTSTPAGVTRVQVEDKGFEASTFVWSSSRGLASAANQLVMVLFLTYFMLLSDQLFKRKLVEIVGTLSQKKITVRVLDDIATQIEQFLVIQILTSGAVAVLTGGALWAMGLQQALLWGLLAGIFNSIPYYGPLLVTAGLSVVGYLQFGTIGMTAAVTGVSLLITTLEGSLLTPMLMGRASSMNQVAVFAGLLFWSWVWGIWGMLLAVPMMMVVKVICDHVEPSQPVGIFSEIDCGFIDASVLGHLASARRSHRCRGRPTGETWAVENSASHDFTSPIGFLYYPSPGQQPATLSALIETVRL